MSWGGSGGIFGFLQLVPSWKQEKEKEASVIDQVLWLEADELLFGCLDYCEREQANILKPAIAAWSGWLHTGDGGLVSWAGGQRL